MAIETFQGDTRFLSSMFMVHNWLMSREGILVPASENLYQADKFLDDDHREYVLQARHGLASKRRAGELVERGVPMRPDWDEVKVSHMARFTLHKFVANPDIAGRLMGTYDQELIEGNTWGDNFWGVCPPGSRNGQNWLGRILVDVRARLMEGNVPPISELII
ncbi:MAG: Swarming motility protein YbiA [Candidatus Saccharibacteria bacterium]|nr:Swarming motility protein YbiA [Candidatus Saccharibacteria bacterium]